MIFTKNLCENFHIQWFQSNFLRSTTYFQKLSCHYNKIHSPRILTNIYTSCLSCFFESIYVLPGIHCQTLPLFLYLLNPFWFFQWTFCDYCVLNILPCAIFGHFCYLTSRKRTWKDRLIVKTLQLFSVIDVRHMLPYEQNTHLPKLHTHELTKHFSLPALQSKPILRKPIPKPMP